MVDLPLAGEYRVIEAVLMLLTLPLGQFTRPEMLKVLTHSAVRARFPEANTDRWRDWCLELGIVHGADRLDHQGTYIDREVFHWQQGLRRLVLGAFMTSPASGDDRPFRIGELEYVPFDQPADALPDTGRLLLLVQSLVADVRFAQSAHVTLTEWSTFFAGLINTYLAADSDPEQRALALCLQKIDELRKLDVTGRKVSYRIAFESLREVIERLTGGGGTIWPTALSSHRFWKCGSLPFRIIFLCGLGEGRFPAASGPDPLDLTRLDPRVGDVNPRQRDKYLFLETLICARERLYLSYVNRDAQTGDPQEPSPVVSELIRHLDRGQIQPVNVWINEQPLRRYDSRYFSDKAGLHGGTRSNFSPAAWKESRARTSA